MNQPAPRSALRITTAGHLRRFSARLLNQVRNADVTEESAVVQNEIAKTLLSCILAQSVAEQEAALMEEVI